MKLSTVSIISAFVIFAATLPHGVGAWLVKMTHTESIVQKLSHREVVMASPRLYARQYAKEKLNKIFGKKAKVEWQALAQLWGKESAWNWKAKNPHSSAYGIAQVLGTPRNSTIEYQVNMGIKYIVHRYETPTNAWKFWKRNGWY
jgi:hypothetical protein